MFKFIKIYSVLEYAAALPRYTNQMFLGLLEYFDEND